MENTNMASPYPTGQIQNNSQMKTKDFIIIILIIALVFTILGINFFALFGYFMKFIADLFKPILASLGFAAGTVLNTTTDLATDTTKFGVDVAGGAIHDIGNLFISASDKNAIPDFKQQYNKYSASLLNGISNASLFKTSDVQYTNTPQSNMPRPLIPASSPFGFPSPSPAPMQQQQQQQQHGIPVPVPVPVPVPIAVPTYAMNVDNTINTPPPRYMNDVASDTSGSNIQLSNAAKKANWCLIGEYKDRRGCVEIEDADRCISGQIFPSQQMCLNPTFSNHS
jgi:hypothetical protein